MHKIHFKRLVAQNFLCFGNEGIDINFDDMSNITIVKGRNYDVASDIDGGSSSNGSGKSSLLDAFIYALFGKTVKNPKKINTKDVINNISGKKLVVEIYFDDYKVQRLRKPDGLKIWKSVDGKWDESTELTRGEMKQTQSLIESIIGFNYETMKSICVFTDNNSDSYLEAVAQDRRLIIENLLGLEKYRKFHEKTKELNKTNKQELEQQTSIKDSNLSLKKTHESNLTIYQNKKKQHIDSIMELIKRDEDQVQICLNVVKQLTENDPEIAKYDQAQDLIKQKETELTEIETKIIDHTNLKQQIVEKIRDYNSKITDYKESMNPYIVEINSIQKDIDKNKSVINKIDILHEGVECEHCFGNVSIENCTKIKYEKENQNKELLNSIVLKTSEIKIIKDNIEKQKELLEKTNAVYIKVTNSLNDVLIVSKTKLLNEINELKKINKPETLITIEKYKNKINLLKSNIIENENNLNSKSPFCDLILSAEASIAEITEKLINIDQIIAEKLNDSKCFEFWLDAFGEKGIRKFIIEQILPILNNTILDMLEILIDGKLSLMFDNEFNDMIMKYPENVSFPYDLLSNGQKRRINLALSQAFAFVRQLNVGNYPNLIFLDEVSINMDSQGNNAIYTLIKMLANDKKVFVTTHDQELLGLLSGNDTLTIEMKNGMSKIAKN